MNFRSFFRGAWPLLLTARVAAGIEPGTAAPLPVEHGTALVTVKAPPIIQPLVPGFTARKIPVQLGNINFLRYRPNGRLYAGGYDGKVYLLRDTDGDGLEDRADVYYESEEMKVVMGLALTPPGDARSEGVYVATHNRILLILDRNRDDRGDTVMTVTKDWEKAQVVGGGVSDAVGLAVGPDGSVYFGLGTSDFRNAYLLDATSGAAQYRTSGERGTIQRVLPDFSRRMPVATGVRVTVGLAFNALGDLFCTEQEGATWLANGNPFDELLHIQPGRHYGFPPRHPQHLPGVVDEPSTFDYGPQHQSTVGLAFDEPLAPGAPIFGPAWWRGDALVAAMSRGKIFRTKLVKTDAGYVAKNETVAQLQRIIIDQAVSPVGALAVTLHSGAPDWGSGPTGAGELWKIMPLAKGTPQPVVTWSASPTELRVTFDTPLAEPALDALQGRVSVTQGRYVEAGDRFETMRPDYQVVKDQLATPRFRIAVEKLALADDAHTLVITTPARSAVVPYGVTIAANILPTAGDSPYAGQLDLLTDLKGLEAEWQPAAGAPLKMWLPHPDTTVARDLTAAGGAHREFWSHLGEAGRIQLRGQLDLGQMLQPAVQPGSKLDWDYPDEQVTVVFTAARPFQFTLGATAVASQAAGGKHEARQQVATRSGMWLPFSIALSAGTGDPAVKAHWFTDRSSTPRPFPLRRILLPYAEAVETAPQPRNEDLPQLAGGNWARGRALYFGQATCATCHSMRDEGGKGGPDLTDLIYRDYDSVLRDITDPNAAIDPEHVAYTVKRQDGTEIVGVLLAANANTGRYALASGETVDLARADIASVTKLTTSLMPPGLDKALSPDQLRDLMTYLLVPPFEPAPVVLPNPPPPRALSEVEKILGTALTAPADPKAKPLRIVLCASEKDKGHGKPGYHDYPLWRSRWSRLLSLAEGIQTEAATDWPSPEQWTRADIVVMNSYNPAWALEPDPAKIEALGAQLDAFLARGGGFVSLHWSLNAGPHTDALAARLGLAWAKGGKYRHGASDWAIDKTHPLAAGFTEWQCPDESYWLLGGDLSSAKARVLATSMEDNEPRPQMWTREVGRGRVFVSIPGHFRWTYDDPLYRILIFRGLMWSAKQPLDRLAPLVTIGARVGK